MKKFLLALLALVIASGAYAQTQVTFNVDMRNATVAAQGVRLAGNLQAAAGLGPDWTPAGTGNQLTDPDGDKVYSITFTIAPGTYNYKFVNFDGSGGWEGNIPMPCGTGSDRVLTVGATAVNETYCFNSCDAACPTVSDVQVTFQVKLNAPPSANGIHVAGAFQGWNPGGTEMTDPDGDGIYTVTLTVQSGSYGYKFVNGNDWPFAEGIPCACAVQNNRQVVAPFGSGPITLPVVCFRSCSNDCPGAATVPVTFRVDMSGEALGPGGLFVAGSFQTPAWQKNIVQLTDADGNDIYDVTVDIPTGEHEYKFFNGTNGDVTSDQYAETGFNFGNNGCGCPGAQFDNRIMVVTAQPLLLPVRVYNSCAETTSGTNDLSTAKNIRVFPNPMSKNAYLEFEGEGQHTVRIADQLGRVVRTYAATAFNGTQLQIEKANLTPGLYLVTLENEKGESAVVKLSVQ